ncbi:IMPACT family protein [Bifidobacterium sp. ESL0763]|uniref:IMPACT family protein n=1 Tax=Bifidobacterium sp. ESL0763 TaxID=2983227 RepID=UPI0023F76EB9|nr:YigZ family protein [Bifidobacterium sp. ESL0763]MDF7663433.1 IMPACT family protein [Bifidobacterium sp. ESL0763]
MTGISRQPKTIDGFSTVVDTSERPAHDSFVEKKSEFIGDVCHVDTLDEALAFVDAIRERHPKARHVAYASIVGAAQGAAKERMSDDGEPSGTAGKPILDVIRVNKLTDCVVTVTRYFGGILLGSGGLIRAYATGASMAVKAAGKRRIVPMTRYRVVLEYPWFDRFEQLLAGVGGEETGREFTDRIRMELAVPSANADDFAARVRETFNARARLTAL